MAGEKLAEGFEIFGGFESVEVVRFLAELQSGGLQLVPTFVIADADTSPIVALENEERAVEVEAVVGCGFCNAMPSAA